MSEPQRISEDVYDFAQLIKGCALSSFNGNVRFVKAGEGGLRPLNRSQRLAIARFVEEQHRSGKGDDELAAPLLEQFGHLDQGGSTEPSELARMASIWEIPEHEGRAEQAAQQSAGERAPLQSAAADNIKDKKERKPRQPDLQAELAPLSTDWETHSFGHFGFLPNPDPVNAQYTSKNGAYQYELGLYEKMYDTYWHLRSVLQQKWGAVISFPRRLEPADESDKAREIRDIVAGLIARISRFQADLREMGVNADLYGFSVHEAITEYRQGWRVPKSTEKRDCVCVSRLASRRSGRFVFGEGEELRLLTKESQQKGQELPERVFIVHRNQTRWDNPYGDGLGKAAYFAFLLVNRTLNYWAQFNERFGSPTVVLFYPSDATARDRAAYKKVVTGFQQNAGVTLPRGTKEELELKLVEPQRYGTLNVYRELLEMCDDAMSKLVLGQTMTTDNGSSLSQAEVHLEVRQDILQDAAEALAETLNDSLIPWLVDWNFPQEYHEELYPVFVIDASPSEDVEARQKVFSQALSDGVALDAEQYYEELKLKRPAGYEELEVIEPRQQSQPGPFDFPAASLDARRSDAAAKHSSAGSRGRGSSQRAAELSTQNGNTNSEAATTNNTAASAVSPVPAGTASSAKAAAELAVDSPACASARGSGAAVSEAARVAMNGRAIPPCSAAAQRQALMFAALHSGDPQLIRRAEHELARLSAAAEDLLPADELRQLLSDGVKAASAALDYLPQLLRDSFLEQAQAALGTEYLDREIDDEVLGLLGGWEREWQADEERKAEFVDRLNDDVTIAGLLGWERVLLAADDEGIESELPAQASHRGSRGSGKLPAITAAERLTNPKVELLFGHERIIPTRVLSILNRRVRQSVSYETFYQLDSLARSAAFTAHDLLVGDVRHIGAALQDATRWGYTVQQFSDYLYERLQARYVVQGDSLHAWHVETIFHQNLAHAWNTENMDAVYGLREDFPYLEFQNPSPQYPVCVEMAGKVWRTDDPVWREYIAPLHWGCGSSIVAITATRYEAEGLSAQSSPPREKPEVYQGPRDPKTGQRVGKPAPFGAWAPLDERYAALEAQLREIDNA